MIKSILEKKKATIDVSLKLLFITKIVKVCFKVKESVLCIVYLVVQIIQRFHFYKNWKVEKSINVYNKWANLEESFINV